MSSKLLYNDTDAQQEAWQTLRNAAKGQLSGIPSANVTKDDIEELAARADAAAAAYGKAPKQGPACMLAYAAAARRDASYSLVGRKYLMVAGLNRKSTYACNRSMILAHINELQDK